MNTNPTNPIPITPELIEALNHIIQLTKCSSPVCTHQIRSICEAIKSGQPLPFKKGE